ncbi:hypothetical protein RND71_020992 [Anisodus tanguticus]|uniref:tRNA-intron lyase n=1 Tax=Anisodus tanguticus TaxID=243964 RepID=A0AAE1V6W6_9SOLA|nr:hypothetical protein RND71_020992 [Anisodus tanguticus]
MNELWKYMTSKKENVPVLYKAYSHLRSKKWVVRLGSQYGVDYVAYRHHPALVHSEYAVLALSEQNGVAEQNSDLRHAAFKPTAPAAKAVVDQFLRIINQGDSEFLIPSIRSIGHLARTFQATETRTISPLVALLDDREPEVTSEAEIALNKFASFDNFLRVNHCKP